MLVKLSSKTLTVGLLVATFSVGTFAMETGIPSMFKTKDQIRLALWYEGVSQETTENEIQNLQISNEAIERSLPVELSHPLDNWNI